MKLYKEDIGATYWKINYKYSIFFQPLTLSADILPVNII